MARISENLYRFSEDMFDSYGFGNPNLAAIFALTALLSLAALTGMYFPALAASMSGLISLSLGGSVFLGISLLSGLSLGGVIFGLVAGMLLASISTTICSLALFLAPPVAALLFIPNIIATIVFLLGGVCSVVEACVGSSSNSADHQSGNMASRANVHSHQDYCRPDSSSAPSYRDPRGDAYFEVSPYHRQPSSREPQPPAYEERNRYGY